MSQSKPLEHLIQGVEKVSENNFHDLNWPELVKVLGNGLMRGSFILLAGEPGVGKSTLILDLIKKLSEKESKQCLYISGEESLKQIAFRAKRMNMGNSKLQLLSESNVNSIVEEVVSLGASLVIIDSIQTMLNPDLEAAPGSISQVKEITQILMDKLKGKNITCIVIGHISKSGNIAGPKVLEHMVDVVLYFELAKEREIRKLYSKKNRFGMAGETAFFKMNELGLKNYTWQEELKEALSSRNEIGQAFALAVSGTRPVLSEIQSLMTHNPIGNGRRVVEGLDSNRLYLLLAILEKTLKINFSHVDIYLRVNNNSKTKPKDLDLAVCASLLSSFWNKEFRSQKVLSGEVQLTGRIKTQNFSRNLEIEIYPIKTIDELNKVIKEKAS